MLILALLYIGTCWRHCLRMPTLHKLSRQNVMSHLLLPISMWTRVPLQWLVCVLGATARSNNIKLRDVLVILNFTKIDHGYSSGCRIFLTLFKDDEDIHVYWIYEISRAKLLSHLVLYILGELKIIISF